MTLRFPALLLAGFTLVACSGGGDPFEVETPDPGNEHKDPDHTDNKPPTASAGQARVVPVGSEVELDGTKSSDPDGDSLSFAWEIAGKPSGSEAALHDTKSRTPRFIADKAGEYEIELSVSDGIASAKDTVIIRANSEPIAKAGADQTSPMGIEVILDGSGSSDPDGDALTYSWAFISRPDGSDISLENAKSVTASFTPDVIGQYAVELTVSDGHAQATARVSVNVTLESGAETSILYLSPTGDDANAGTKSEPLKTIAEALDRAEANSDIKRFVLASGTYEEAFDHEISRKLEIVGPAEGHPAAILKGERSLFTVKGQEAGLTLLRVKLESGDIALHIFDEGSLSATSVECEAKGCIHGVEDDDEQRPSGTVEVSKSKFSGLPVSSPGISLQNGSLTIRESTVEGFTAGIDLMGVSVFMRETTVRQNSGNGLSIVYGDSSGTVIEDSVIDKNTKGIYLYSGRNVTVRDTEIIGRSTVGQESTHGIEIHGSSGLVLDGVTIRGFLTAGLLVGSNGSYPVKMRNSLLEENGNGIVVQNAASMVDLGNQSESGENVITSFHISGRTRGYSIDDRRPANSDGSGYIRLSKTRLRSIALPSGSYTSAHATYNCSSSPRTLCIENTGNTVVAY